MKTLVTLTNNLNNRVIEFNSMYELFMYTNFYGIDFNHHTINAFVRLSNPIECVVINTTIL